MGQSEIEKKLNDILKCKIKYECQVVYILSRIRKIISKNSQYGKYGLLNLYCNWSLHNELTNPDTVRILSLLLEPSIDDSKSGHENASLLKYNLNDLFKLNTFKKQLDDFFEEYSLPKDLLIGQKWVSFMKLLFGIIKECEISFNVSLKPLPMRPALSNKINKLILKK